MSRPIFNNPQDYTGVVPERNEMMIQAKRGFVPSDENEFGERSLPKLRRAAEDVYYLINRGYKLLLN